MIIYRGKCEEINTRVSISFLKTMLSIFQFYPNLIITRLRYRHTALNSRTECSTGSVPDVGEEFQASAWDRYQPEFGQLMIYSNTSCLGSKTRLADNIIPSLKWLDKRSPPYEGRVIVSQLEGPGPQWFIAPGIIICTDSQISRTYSIL